MGTGAPQRLLEQAFCELRPAEQGAVGRQGEKPVCLEPSPVLWDLANPEARKGVAPAVAGGMPQGQGTLQAAGTSRSHFPRTGPVGWRGVGALAEAASAARGKGLGADARAFPRHEHTARCAPARARRVPGA